MKIKTIILVALFIIGIVISSCNRKLCPAYSKTSTEQVAGRS
jgi:hypothetical protein